MKFSAASFSFIASIAVLSAAAEAQKPETHSAPLRHLVFAVAIETTYTSEFGGLRAVGDPFGSGNVQTKRGQTANGTIVCDVVDINRQTGDLLVDVSEDAGERKNPTSRLILRLDGKVALLPNQRPLTEEESMLLPLLARGYIGPEIHPLDTFWEVAVNDEGYAGKATFRVTAIHPPDDESLTFDEEFRYTGANGYSGNAHGQLSYDPTKLVPRRLEVQMTTRLQQLGHDTFMKYQMNYALKEDSFATR